jgi:hypothetical protein
VANQQSKKGGKGGRKSSNRTTKARRRTSWLRTQKKKDARVKRSSHGKYASRAELEAASGQKHTKVDTYRQSVLS